MKNGRTRSGVASIQTDATSAAAQWSSRPGLAFDGLLEPLRACGPELLEVVANRRQPLRPQHGQALPSVGVEDTGAGTSTLRFIHHGLLAQECADVCRPAWQGYLSSLVALAETGEGSPWQPGMAAEGEARDRRAEPHPSA